MRAGRRASAAAHCSWHGAARLRRVLDVGVGPVAAGRRLDMPAALLVLVFDDLGVARHHLLGRRDFRRAARLLMRREGLGIDALDPVGPAAVVLDDLVGDVAHGWPSEVAGAGSNVPSSPEVARWPKKFPTANAKGAGLSGPRLRNVGRRGLPAAAMLGDPAVEAAGRGFSGLLFLAQHLVRAPRLGHTIVPHLADAGAFP